MAHQLLTAATVISAGSEPVVPAFNQVAVGGEALLQLCVNNTGAGAIATSGQSISGADAAHFAIRVTAAASIEEATAPDIGRRVIDIAYIPTATGTHNATFNITIEATTYAVPIRGICGTATVAIEDLNVGDKMAPCGIKYRFSRINSRLPAKQRDCLFVWRITTPAGQTYSAADPRPGSPLSPAIDLTSFFPGIALDWKVGDTDHGTYQIALDVYVPGDEIGSPSLSSSPSTKVVAANTRTISYMSPSGAGAHDGTLGNEWTLAEARTALSGTDNFWLKGASGTYTAPDANGLNFGDSTGFVVTATSGRVVIRPDADTAGHYCLKVGNAATPVKGSNGYFRDIDFEPPQTGSAANATAVYLHADDISFVDCRLLGDGASGGTHTGDSFLQGVEFDETAVAGFTLLVGCKGIGLHGWVGAATVNYGMSGYVQGLCVVADDLDCSTNESVFRSLGKANYALDAHDFPSNDCNWVCCSHNTDGDDGASESKQAWRITKGMGFTFFRCYASGECWLGMTEAAGGARHSYEFSCDECAFIGNAASGGGVLTLSRGGRGYHFRSCVIGRNVAHTAAMIGAGADSDFRFTNCTLYNGASGGTQPVVSTSAGLGQTVPSYFDRCLFPNAAGNMAGIDDSAGALSATPSVINCVFPGGANGFNTVKINNTVYGSPLFALVDGKASGCTEMACTLDGSDYTPTPTTPGFGRSDYAYRDYYGRTITDRNSWAGCTQDTNERADLYVTISDITCTDDAEEQQDGAGFNRTNTTIRTSSHTTTESSRFTAGWYFPSVGIPPGAEVIRSTLKVQPNNTTNDNFSTAIKANDVDSAVDFTADADVDTRFDSAGTTAQVVFRGNGMPSASGVQPLPDLKQPVQEWVDRAGHTTAANLVLLMGGNSVATALSRLLSVENGSGIATFDAVYAPAASGVSLMPSIVPLLFGED